MAAAAGGASFTEKLDEESLKAFSEACKKKIQRAGAVLLERLLE